MSRSYRKPYTAVTGAKSAHDDKKLLRAACAAAKINGYTYCKMQMRRWSRIAWNAPTTIPITGVETVASTLYF